MAPRQRMHTVRNVRVRLFEAGDDSADPLVFLHGAGGVEPWLPFFDRLAERHRVVVPEHPGFGASDDPACIRDVSDAAMYYLDFLDDLTGDGGGQLTGNGGGRGARKVHLVGHSLGGWIAAEVATRNCGHLRSLTLLAPAGVRIKGVPCGDNFIWSPEESARNLVHDQAFAERAIAAVAAQTDEEADRALVNRYASAKFGWEPRWFNPALERWLHRIQVPALVLWGAEDRLLPVDYAQVWGREVPAVTVGILKDCGHLLTVERADDVAARVLAFTGSPS